jgi:hypothetical protein
MVADLTSERHDGPTPAGGVASVAYWQDANGNATTKELAVAAEIVELDAGGNIIARTYAEINRAPLDPPAQP